MSAQRPLEYAVQVCGTGIIEWGGGKQFGMVLPFDATQLIVSNDGSFDAFLTFASTAASTGGFRLSAGERLQLAGIRTSVIGLVATATSTSESFRIAAWAW